MGTATFGQRGEVVALQKFDKIRACSSSKLILSALEKGLL